MDNKDNTEGAPLEFTPDVDIMTVLLQHEKRAETDGPGKKNGPDADSSDEDLSKIVKNEPSIGSGNIIFSTVYIFVIFKYIFS